MSFKDLKKQSKLGSLTAKLVKEVEKMNNTGGNADDRIWKLDVDKGGNGYAVIRFLPAPEGEDLPFVKLYSLAGRPSSINNTFLVKLFVIYSYTVPIPLGPAPITIKSYLFGIGFKLY